MKKGVSLPELLAVVIVSGIIISIAVPVVGNAIDKAKKNAFIEDIHTIQTSAQTYCSKNNQDKNCLSTSLSLLGSNPLKPYISKNFKKYDKASVLYNGGFYVDLKNDTYETREVTYDANTKTFTYTQKDLLPNSNIKDFVVKNKN